MAQADVVISQAIPVFKGERVRMKVNGGYMLCEVEEDGLYINADCPILSRNEAAAIVKHIDAERARERRREKRRIAKSPLVLMTKLAV